MSSTKPATPEPTEIAGRYQVVQKLGAGAFGTVYKASDTRLRGRMVAIKTIRLEGLAASTSSLDDLLKRFKLEADIAANLKHPNIVTIYDVGEADGLTYLAMEFIDGVGLDRVIAGSGKMSVERAASIGAQVADALGYAHKNGVIHRDIKPANIMIEPGDHVKVTDFGIAKMTDQGGEHLTVTGSLLGTPSYMSPEQARGGKIDGRSDLFSVGCLLYEMVAGQKAFRGESITALLFKIITEEPPPLRTIDPTVSDEMLRIIGRALSKAPETRYQTGRELADDLLAVTRPGFVPTLRTADAPTLSPDAPPGDVPTIASAPTVRSEATLSSAPTAARPAPPLPTRPAPGAPQPLPPTVLTPPTARVEAPPAARPAHPGPPPASRPTARKGGGAGLIVGLGLAGALALAVVAGGAWYLFGRKPAPPEPVPTSGTAVQETATPPPAVPPTMEAGPSPRAEAVATVATAEPRPTPRAGGGASVAGAPVATRVPVEPPPPAAPPVTSAPPAPGGDDYAFLDEPPSDTPDGRAAGEALARMYRGSGSSGGSSGTTATRFPRRPKVPRDLVPAERPAAATLLYVHLAQEAYHQKKGRYGSLRDLADAGTFALDVPFNPDGFRRAGRSRAAGGAAAPWAFRLTLESDGYRMDATPLGPFGRALMVDDSGFVRFPD